MRKAVFLDRDGVINKVVPNAEGPDSPRSVNEFQLIRGAGRAIERLNRLGFPVVVVSNQPGIAKGKLCLEDLDAMTDLMRQRLSEESAVLDRVYYCLHHPDAVVAEYRVLCECRKPGAGLLTKAERELDLVLAGSYMVGDQQRDMTAGKSVGCTTVFVTSGGRNERPTEADYMCKDLANAARLIAKLEDASLATH